jgi:hypothetical protein
LTFFFFFVFFLFFCFFAAHAGASVGADDPLDFSEIEQIASGIGQSPRDIRSDHAQQKNLFFFQSSFCSMQIFLFKISANLLHANLQSEILSNFFYFFSLTKKKKKKKRPGASVPAKPTPATPNATKVTPALPARGGAGRGAAPVARMRASVIACFLFSDLFVCFSCSA